MCYVKNLQWNCFFLRLHVHDRVFTGGENSNFSLDTSDRI